MWGSHVAGFLGSWLRMHKERRYRSIQLVGASTGRTPLVGMCVTRLHVAGTDQRLWGCGGVAQC